MTLKVATPSAETFFETVVRECERAVPLGAYATKQEARYLFLADSGPFALCRDLEEDQPLRAVSSAIPLFSWDEREMTDECGVRFEDMPDIRALRIRQGEIPPAVVAHGDGISHFVVGPVHAGIIEPGRFTFSSGGETVVHLDAQLSYSHRGAERQLEGEPAVRAAWMVARICGGCSASRSLAYAMALEQLAGVTVDEESDLARLILAELERIYNHLADLAACASGAGFQRGFALGMALKERGMQLCLTASSHRLLFDAIVPGGVGSGALSDRPAFVRALADLECAVNDYLDHLFGNDSMVSRWHSAGTISREMARAFGAVGPTERASNGRLDVRAFAAYGAYRWIRIQAAHASKGDVLARCGVKRDELRESFRLIRESTKRLGKRPLSDPLPLTLPRGAGMAVVEGPRGTEVVAVHVGEKEKLERVHVISASYRNWPLVARAMDGNIVPDFPLVNKSFNLCYACADR